MTWKKVSEEFAGYLDDVMRRFTCEKKRMFGCPCWFVNGQMFAGAWQENVLLRLSEQDRRELFQDFDEAAPFEPMKGRVMKEYATIPASLADDREVLNDWLDRAYAFARTQVKKPARPGAKPSKNGRTKRLAGA